MIKATKVIAIEMGNHILVRKYEEPIFSGFKNYKSNLPNKESWEYKKVKNKKRSFLRTRDTIISLVLSNFTINDKWITLGFDYDIEDASEAVTALKEFIKKLKKRFSDLKYLITLEKGDQNGKLHFHMVANFPFIKKSILDELWGNGSVYIKNINDVDGGTYNLAKKYITKQYIYDPSPAHPLHQLEGKRRYWCSSKMNKSIKHTGEDAIKLLRKNKGNLFLTEEKTIENTYKGAISDKVFKRKKSKLKNTRAKNKVAKRSKDKLKSIKKVQKAIVDLNTKSARKIAVHIKLSPSYVHKIIKEYIN
jgi:hypothetical protein